jgi:aminopeptidase N
VLKVAARYGDRALFDKMVAAAKHADDRHDREVLLQSLGSFTDSTLAKAALDVAAAGTFDPRETLGLRHSLLGAQTRDRRTRAGAWDFTRAHFDEMTKELSGEMMAYAPHVPATFCDAEHETEMTAFFKDRSPKLPGGPRLLAQAQEQTELCRASVAAQRPSVTSFLKKY